jgi:hypothetical protein
MSNRHAYDVEVMIPATHDSYAVGDQDAAANAPVALESASLPDVDVVADLEPSRRPQHGSNPYVHAAPENDVFAQSVVPMQPLP